MFKSSLKTFILLMTFGLILPTSLWAEAEKRAVKYLSLYVGVYHDEEVPAVPKKIKQTGTFKGYTKIIYNPVKKSLRFYPTKAGLVTLFINDPVSKQILYEFRLDIQKTNLNKIAKEIRELIRGVDGISIKIINGKVVVDGQILLPKDMARIHSVVKQYGNLASSLVTLSPLAQRKIAQLIERDINNPEVTVRSVNGKFILEGTVDGQRQKEQAEIIAKAYVPDVVVDEAVADKKVLERTSDVVINLINIREAQPEGPKKIVQVVVHYVELYKDYNKGFRFQWTPDLGDGSSVSFQAGSRGAAGVVSTITGTISNLLPKLNWAKEHGHARVLRSTSIIVEDGKKGSVITTQGVPYKNVTKDGLPTTSFAKTGITTMVTPQIIGQRSDSVKLDMTFEMSALVEENASGPVIAERKINTTVVVRSGESAAVGGLISNERGTTYNKLPSNSSSNPLVSLYASKAFRNNKSQFVVFVTPVIKSSASSGADKIKKKFDLKQ